MRRRESWVRQQPHPEVHLAWPEASGLPSAALSNAFIPQRGVCIGVCGVLVGLWVVPRLVWAVIRATVAREYTHAIHS